MQITEEQLLEWNQRGLIPGPNESEIAFVKRVAYSLDLKNALPELCQIGTPATEEISEEAKEITSKLFDFYPDWAPIGFSNRQLMPWHGGCAWIFQVNEESPTAACLQLRKEFASKKKLWGLYDRQELTAHELCHVGRLMFNEPHFEELIAYQTAGSKFRRWWSPIVQSSVESMIFILSLFLVIMLDIYAVAVEPLALPMAILAHLVPLSLIGYGAFRLYRKQKQYARCLKNLEGVTNIPEAVAFRLTDEEIKAFAMAPDQITEYANNQKCLRWRVIRSYYVS